MACSKLNVDYLVVGAGAATMAFVASMAAMSKSTFAIVDCRSRPGGHWNDVYPPVRLHQPSTAFGVNSNELRDGSVESVRSRSHGTKRVRSDVGCNAKQPFALEQVPGFEILARRVAPHRRFSLKVDVTHPIDDESGLSGTC